MILAGICAEFFGVRGYQLDWRLFLKVLVASTFISGAVASLFLYPIQDAGHVAAWVQAVRMIASIIGAFLVVQYQISQQIEMQKREWENRDRELLDKEQKRHDATVSALEEVVSAMVQTCQLLMGAKDDKINSKVVLLAVKKQIEIQLSVVENTDLMIEPLVHYAASAIAIKHEIVLLLSDIKDIESMDEATYSSSIPHRYAEAMERQIGYLNGYRDEILDKRAKLFNK